MTTENNSGFTPEQSIEVHVSGSGYTFLTVGLPDDIGWSEDDEIQVLSDGDQIKLLPKEEVTVDV